MLSGIFINPLAVVCPDNYDEVHWSVLIQQFRFQQIFLSHLSFMLLHLWFLFSRNALSVSPSLCVFHKESRIDYMHTKSFKERARALQGKDLGIRLSCNVVDNLPILDRVILFAFWGYLGAQHCS